MPIFAISCVHSKHACICVYRLVGFHLSGSCYDTVPSQIVDTRQQNTSGENKGTIESAYQLDFWLPTMEKALVSNYNIHEPSLLSWLSYVFILGVGP